MKIPVKLLIAAATFFAVIALNNTRLLNKTFAQDDITPPTSATALSPPNPDGINGWYVTPLDITISTDDLQSGVQSINYKLDSDALQTQTFSDTLNLVQNPSFETADSPISMWDKVNDDGGAVYSQDTQAAPSLGTKSARIYFTSGTWHAFSNQTNFSVASPSQNMTSSLWLKTQITSGSAYYKIYALYDAGGGSIQSQLLTTSSSVIGTSGWQKISTNFVVNNVSAIGVYMEAGIDGVGTVWFDGASITSSLVQPSLNFAVSSNGNHSLNYYSIDNAGNEETPHHTSTFKIDTKAPSRWTNFTITEAGNNHTFIVSISVSDKTSGLDVSTAEFQYSVDEGVTWGYYTNTLGCSSSFIQGWAQASTSPNADGSIIVTMTTPALDFCNSNWATTKKIRFRIADMAGNNGQSGDFTINGAWIAVSDGDTYSNNSISMRSNSTVDYLAGASDEISNVSSAKSWFLEGYGTLPFDSYDTWYAKYPTTTPPPNNKVPKVSGTYLVNNDFTIASATLPSGLSTTTNLSAMVFVNGDLNINSNYSLHDTSGIIFVVEGDITVGNSVSKIDSYFISDDLFDLGSGSTQIDVWGGVQADSFNIKRSLNGNQNSSSPSQIFKFQPKYLIIGRNLLGSETEVTWLGEN